MVALESSGLAYCSLCAKAVLDRVKAFRALVVRVRKSEDLEAVHDMRVASRRLRAALALLGPCLPQQTDDWRKVIRKVTRALGRARDLDVQIATVRSSRQKRGCRWWRAGMGQLLADLRRRRRSAQGKVDKALNRMARSGVLEEMDRSMGKIVQAASKETHPDSVKTYRLAGNAIRALLDDLESYEADLFHPEAIERHHEMRIAAKRLRYSLEVLEPLFGPALAPFLRAARGMQTLLGDLHDCDVWVESLPKFLAAETVRAGKDSKRLRWLAKSIEAFRRDCINRRRTLYRRSVAYWKKCRKEKTWLSLRQILARPLSRRRPPLRTLRRSIARSR